MTWLLCLKGVLLCLMVLFWLGAAAAITNAMREPF